MNPSFSTALMYQANRRAAAAHEPRRTPEATPSALRRAARFVVESAAPCHPQSALIAHHAVARHPASAAAPETTARESCPRCESRPLGERLRLAFEVMIGRDCDCEDTAA